MPRKCTFCTHRDCNKLEIAILKGEKTQKEVANILGVAQSRVSEHMSKHIKKDIRNAIARDESVKNGLDVIKQLLEINKVCRVIVGKALQRGNDRLALQAVDRIRAQLELQAKLLGDITTGVNIQIVNSPQFVEFKTLILRILEKYPEVKNKVVEELKRYLDEGFD